MVIAILVLTILMVLIYYVTIFLPKKQDLSRKIKLNSISEDIQNKKRKIQPNANSCIFCGGSNLSHEHILGDWIRNVIPRANSGRSIERFGENYLGNGSIEWAYESRNKQGHLANQKIRNVCQSCNNGWMSSIEKEVQPVLTSLFLSQPKTLSKKEQTLIATWSIKNSIMNEYVFGENSAVPDSDRITMYSEKLPPKGWKVWLGKMTSEDKGDYFLGAHKQWVDGQSGPSGSYNEFNALLTTIRIGNLVIFTAKNPYETLFDLKFEGYFAKRMTQIYPIYQATISLEKLKPLTLDEMEISLMDYMPNKYFPIESKPKRPKKYNK